MPFWCLLGAILGSFWRHFGDKVLIRKVLRFRGRPRSERGSPRRPPQGQKAGFSLEGCLKSRVDLLASGCLRELFWRPKWSQNGVKIDSQITKNAPRKSLRISTAKVLKSGAKMTPKRIPNGTKIHLISDLVSFSFLLIFEFRRPGHLGGRRGVGSPSGR